MSAPTPEHAELHHPLPTDRIGAAPQRVTLVPDAEARAALARRFGLIALDAMRAELQIRRRSDTGWIQLRGTVEAEVVQQCVVSLDPVSSKVVAELDETFVDADLGGRERTGAREVDVDPMLDEPEPLDENVLDLGEIAAQAFGLALDPYPRAPDATLGPRSEIGELEDPEDARSPFAALEALRDRAGRGRDVKKS